MIFISHSHADLDIARRLDEQFLTMGRSSWLDASHIPVGERFVRAIGTALSQASVIVFIDSDSSRKSYWCRREWLAAMRLRDIGRVRCLIALQPGSVGEPSEFAPDHVVTSVSDAVELVRDLAKNQTTLPVPDVHSGVIEEVHGSPEPAVWLGFSDVLAALDEWWIGRDSGCWVAGVGGAGKTSLILTWLRALEVIGYRDALHFGAIAWSFYNDRSASSALEQIQRWLQMGTFTSRLVLWDGVERLSEDDLSVVLRKTKHWGVKYIATSRTIVPVHLAESIHAISLSSLSLQDACVLLEKCGMSPGTSQRIANALRGNPLAISIASSEIKRGVLSAEDVLRIYRDTADDANR